MDERLLLSLLALIVALRWVACGHVFFHEPSAILVKPGGETNSSSDFGFALGFWNESLIVSSPSSDLIGEVYRCPLVEIVNNSLNCSGLNLFNSTRFSRDINPNQHYHLGASIAATKDYLFTCAPLVTKIIKRIRDRRTYPDAIGSCFIYSNETSVEYKGPESRFSALRGSIDRIAGGTGWNTLVDEENGFLIVAKTSVFGDINYLSISEPEKTPKALSETEIKSLGEDILDVGYGLTTGNFFSNETVYAFSKQSVSMTGQIVFLEVEQDPEKDKMLKLKVHGKTKTPEPYMLKNDVVGAMFGYALGAADLNSDGLSELLVGAPMMSEDQNEVEFGALHIYLGGDIGSLNDVYRMRTIFGAKNMSRFGSTIATSDIDGDSIPEVFVSAPYEDTGVVYILSGYELMSALLRDTRYLTMQVSKLQHSQRVVRSDLALFGFSLLTMPDLDGNGCKELVIGAPGAASALLLKCFQTINVNVTSELIGTSVKERDDFCTVLVCLQIEYNTQTNNISGHISVKNDIDGYAEIRNSTFKVNLSNKTESHCHEIVVGFKRHEKYDYVLKTKLELENDKTLESKDFDISWAQLSIYSNTECKLPIFRRCVDDCNPRLYLDFKWNNTESTQIYESKGNKTKTLWYEVESSEEEMISIVVTNNGSEASDACVWVEITGAPVYKPGKCSPKPPQNPKGYECSLPTSFRQGDENTFDILLNMSRLSNSDKELVVTARPYENCIKKVSNASRERIWPINYSFKQAWQRVKLEGIKHDLIITDTEISEEELNKYDEKANIFQDKQQYWITNNGSVMWNRSVAVIEVENRPFITKVGATEKNCNVLEGESQYTITCPLTLLPAATTKIIAWAEMSRKKVGDNLKSGQRINVKSQMTLFMDSPQEKADLEKYIQKSLVTDIVMKQDKSFKNNQMLIALVAALLALLLLALVTYCLCKKGFFKRKEKKKLAVLRESVRRHSMRLASERSTRLSQKSHSNADNGSDINIEVVDDSPFEDIAINSKDNVVLVEAEADVHYHKDDAKKGKTDEHEKKA